jgi:hypothetical protein
MQKFESRIGQYVEETAGASKPRRLQSLRLDKQTIRTLTGAELKLVAGGMACSCGHTSQSCTNKEA